MAHITLRELKQYLRGRSHDELTADIAELFSAFGAVRDYYQLRLAGGSGDEVGAAYKAAIQKEFFPARGYGQARLSVARKPIADYRKLSPSAESIVDLMLFYVEMGVQYTNTYGDITEAFCSSMEGMYDNAVTLIARHNLHDRFRARCEKIVADTRNIGWGFHDTLSEIYHEHFAP